MEGVGEGVGVEVGKGKSEREAEGHRERIPSFVPTSACVRLVRLFVSMHRKRSRLNRGYFIYIKKKKAGAPR